jgi:hypothetical protein
MENKIYIDRQAQLEQIQIFLDQIQNEDFSFAALEFYGIGGLGKSCILEQAKQQCRSRGLPFVLIDFLTSDQTQGDLPVQNNPELRFLLRLCDQLDHYLSLSAARAELNALARSGFHQEEGAFKETMIKFRERLIGALDKYPLILMLDSLEHCPAPLFDWVGQGLIAPMISSEKPPSVILFMAGRGPSVNDSRWSKALKNQVSTFCLDPLDFAATEEHICSLTPQGYYRAAAPKIYHLSNGHPYSTEAVVYELNKLGIQVNGIDGQHQVLLAQRLHEEVIHKYILANAPEWILPFVEMASIPRRFNAGFLSKLVSHFRPELARQQPIQWYQARLADLQERPWHLVYVTRDSYKLDTTLRKLLHTALVILDPEKVKDFHSNCKDLYEGVATASALSEILYHAAQIAIVGHETKLKQRMNAEIQRLLKKNFNPRRPHDLEELILLKDVLNNDKELFSLLDQDPLESLVEQIDKFLTPPPPLSLPFQSSHLVIEHFQPSEYRVSWFHANQMVLTTEHVHSARHFSLDRWRDSPERIGKTAFGAYLPTRTQEFIHTHNDWAIQLMTNTVNIPWELLHDNNDFLCLSRPIARKPKMTKEPKEHKVKKNGKPRALVIGNPTGNLPGAETEAREITRMLKQAGVEVDLLIGKQATAEEFAIQIANQYYDLIHFAGHGQFDPEKPYQSSLVFADDQVVYAEELERTLNSPAFLFLSTCEGAQATAEKTQLGFRGEFMEGIAVSALLGGAIGCLGPMWKIDDQIAQKFALTFYAQLLNQVVIGEAVRQARLAVRSYSTDFWASWVLYGDPLQAIFE